MLPNKPDRGLDRYSIYPVWTQILKK